MYLEHASNLYEFYTKKDPASNKAQTTISGTNTGQPLLTSLTDVFFYGIQPHTGTVVLV